MQSSLRASATQVLTCVNESDGVCRVGRWHLRCAFQALPALISRLCNVRETPYLDSCTSSPTLRRGSESVLPVLRLNGCEARHHSQGLGQTQYATYHASHQRWLDPKRDNRKCVPQGRDLRQPRTDCSCTTGRISPSHFYIELRVCAQECSCNIQGLRTDFSIQYNLPGLGYRDCIV